MVTQKFQEETFNHIIRLKHGLQSLSSFVQNDFTLLLNDGYVSKEEIKQSINDLEKAYSKFINELNEVKEDSIKILKFYSNE